MSEGGPRNYQQDVNTLNVTGTLGGEFSVGDRRLFWDANAVWSKNRAEQSFTGNVNAQRVQQALGPPAQCAGSCVPLNIFGGVGSITPEMLRFIAFTQQDTSEQELRDYSANLTGDLLQLPAGPLAFAVGAEHRKTEGFFQPDATVAAGLSSDIPAQPASGEITVKEFYGELQVPIVADRPQFQELEVSGAVRWFDYSTSGSDSTYRAALRWRPTQDVLVRLSRGQGFRAPSIGELFGTASRFDQEVVDPCSNFLGLGGGTPASATVRANCISRGVPANGSYTQLNPQLPVVTSGNPNLTPETSEGYNASAVWEPAFLKGASFASGGSIELAYSKIELEDAIQAQSGDALLTRCAQTNDPLACATITRTASGAVAGIANPLINIGRIETEAVDLNLVYSAPEMALGRIVVRSFTTFLLDFTEFVPSGAGLTPIERQGTERGSPDQAYPETKSTLVVDWDRDALGATGTLRYISAIEESQAANTLGSRTYADLQLRWRPSFVDGFGFAAGINNLFDEDPPGCVSCGLNNFDPNAYDAPGRVFYLRFNYRQ